MDEQTGFIIDYIQQLLAKLLLFQNPTSSNKAGLKRTLEMEKVYLVIRINTRGVASAIIKAFSNQAEAHEFALANRAYGYHVVDVPIV